MNLDRFNPRATAAVFNCTVSQLRKQYLQNAGQLKQMADKAEAAGGYCNGMSVQRLRAAAADATARAAICASEAA